MATSGTPTTAAGKGQASERRKWTVGLLVLVPLAVLIVSSALIGATHPYPGIAMGSGAVLVFERALAVWVGWLLILVIGDQAVRGRLPDEMGGRGVKYADASQVDQLREEFTRALKELEDYTGDVDLRVKDVEAVVYTDGEAPTGTEGDTPVEDPEDRG